MPDMRPLLPVPASGWFNTQLAKEEREMLLKQGIAPVNDVFLRLFGDQSKIKLLFGGFGSGKSDAVAEFIVDHIRKDQYVRVCFGRKVLDKVRKSCHSKLVSVIKRHALEGEFKFSIAPTGTMEIKHIATGNDMFPFGAANADEMKSVDDPTLIWMEEGDQFEEGDLTSLLTRLRTPKSQELYLIISFNTNSVFPGHWLLKLFFPELLTDKERNDVSPELYEQLAQISILKIFCNYVDNHFIDKEEYYRALVLASGGNKQLLDGIARGAWGTIDNKNPWMYAFDYEEHTVDDIPFLPTFPVYVSFDFNNDPFACTLWQHTPAKGTQHSFIHCIREFSGNYKIEDICSMIKANYPNSILYVTGDRSGQNEDVGRNQTLYQIIAGYLGLKRSQLNLNTTNLEHSDSRLFINAMFANYPHIRISRKGCPGLIRQCQLARPDEESTKPSQLMKDRGLYKMDEFDSMRYFFQTYYHEFAKDKYFKAIGLKK